jgi:hypothetical protein
MHKKATKIAKKQQKYQKSTNNRKKKHSKAPNIAFDGMLVRFTAKIRILGGFNGVFGRFWGILHIKWVFLRYFTYKIGVFGVYYI